MSAAPLWRRAAPASGSSRLLASIVLLGAVAALALFVALPLYERFAAAEDRATRLNARAAALEAAAEARLAEARLSGPDAALTARAVDWLDENAPMRDPDAAMLDLISSLRLLAEASDVALAAATPLDGARAAELRDFAAAAELAGLHASGAEARLTSDHAGLVRFLEAVEAARPTMRAAHLDISARSSAASAEGERLSVRVIVAAFSRSAPE